MHKLIRSILGIVAAAIVLIPAAPAAASVAGPRNSVTVSAAQARVTKLNLTKVKPATNYQLRFEATTEGPTAISSVTTHWNYIGFSDAYVSPYYPLYHFDGNAPGVYSWNQGTLKDSDYNGLWIIDHLEINGPHATIRTMSRRDLIVAGVQTVFLVS